MASGGAFVILLDEVATLVKATAEKAIDRKQEDATQKRDLSVIFAVAKGSVANKAILVPAALAINFFTPWAVLPMLAAGGAFFAYEGMKKAKAALRGHHFDPEAPRPGEAPEAARARKIKTAIKTDMVLSAEITAITLAAVATFPIASQALIMGTVAMGATLGIYSVIAGIIKMEDAGAWLERRQGEGLGAKSARALGRGILAGKPHVLKGISVAGGLAIFMVGGGLVLHGIPALGHVVHDAVAGISGGPYLHSLARLGASFATGVATGILTTPALDAARKPLKKAVRHLGAKAAAVAGALRGRLQRPAPQPDTPAPATDDMQAAMPFAEEPANDAFAACELKPAFDRVAQGAQEGSEAAAVIDRSRAVFGTWQEVDLSSGAAQQSRPPQKPDHHAP
jgi:predicted DNA repair protein MutK